MVRYVLIVLVISSVIFSFPCAGEIKDTKDIVVGQSTVLFSHVLNEDRAVFIACPDDYAESNNRYPVLYTLDAEQYFHYTVSLVQSLAKNGRMPQMIVVGIPNTDRSRDFSYRRNEDDSLMGADHFFHFLKDELIPFVDQNYRTTSYRIIKGWCATGIFCIYCLFTHPDIFNAYITSSPYLVNDAGFIFQLVEDYPRGNLKSREFLFMSVGGQDRPDLKAKIPKFVALLERKNLNGLEWHFVNLDNEDHYTIDFRTSYLGLEALYPDLIHLHKLTEGGIESARIKIQLLAERYGLEGSFSEEMLTEMGYHLMNQELFADALTIFKVNAEVYPDSWNAYDNIGEAYMMLGDNELAIQFYRKSLEMNPENSNAVQMLEKLENQ